MKYLFIICLVLLVGCAGDHTQAVKEYEGISSPIRMSVPACTHYPYSSGEELKDTTPEAMEAFGLVKSGDTLLSAEANEFCKKWLRPPSTPPKYGPDA